MLKKMLSNNQKFFVCCLLNILLFMPLLVYGGQNFSIDSYGVALDQSRHIFAFIGSYRWFGAVAYKAFNALTGHNPVLCSTVDIVVFIILVAIFISLLTNCIVELIGKKDRLLYIIVDLGVLVSVANVWFCNILSFPECVFITAIGVCLCFGAVVAYITLKGWRRYLVSGLLAIFSTGVYQQFISVFAIYIIAICGIEIFIQNKITFKQIFSHYIKSAILIILSGSIYFAVGKLFQMIFNVEANSRVNLSISGIVDNVIYFIKNQHSFLKGRGFFESELLTVSFLIIGFIWLVYMIGDWIKNKRTIRTIFLFSSYAVAYASAYLPGILSTSHAARAMFALFSVFSLFLIGIVLLSNEKYIKVITCFIMMIVLVANLSTSIKVELIQKEQNKVDRSWCETIIGEIEKYEKENNTKVQTIEFCCDQDSDLSLDKSESAVGYAYSLENMINYYSGRSFDVIGIMDEKQKELFEDKEWDIFVVEEQLVFDGNILYLCCY